MATESNSSSPPMDTIRNISDQQQTSTRQPDEQAKSTLLKLSNEILTQIISHVIYNDEIEITGPWTRHLDEFGTPILDILESTMLVCRKFNVYVKVFLAMPKHQKLSKLLFTGLFDPETTVWKIDRPDIDYPGANANHLFFDWAIRNPDVQEYARIIQVDMSFDPRMGETELSIHEPSNHQWPILLESLKNVKRIDLLIHGKLDPLSKAYTLDSIWRALSHCYLYNQRCDYCIKNTPRVRWRNVNRVKGRWRDIKMSAVEDAVRYKHRINYQNRGARKWEKGEKWEKWEVDLYWYRWGVNIFDPELKVPKSEYFSEEEDAPHEDDIVKKTDYSLVDKFKKERHAAFERELNKRDAVFKASRVQGQDEGDTS